MGTKGHSVKEVVESAGVSKRLVIRVDQQWQKSQTTGHCGQKTKLTDRDCRRVSPLVNKNHFVSRKNCFYKSTQVLHNRFLKEHPQGTTYHEHMGQSGTREAIAHVCSQSFLFKVDEETQTLDCP